MKKFTLFAASALLTLSVSAASVKVAPHHAKAESLKNRTERMSDKQANKLRAQGKTLIDASKIRKAPAKEEEQEATIVSSAMVTEQPAGTLSTWSRNCDSYWTFWGFLIHEQVVGSAQQMVDGEDGKLWLNGILSQWPLPDNWMYLEKNEDDSYTYPGPQLVYQEEYMGDIYDYYLVPFTLGEDEEGYAVTTPCQTVNFNMVDGKLVQEVTEDEVLLGLFEYDAEEGFLWTGYTDWNIVFEPMTSVAATLPEGVAAEKWVAVSGDSGYFTEVAIDGAKIYVKGLVYGNDEGVAVGTINGDEVTFAAGQFLGADPYGYWTYLYGGQIEEEWDDYWEEYVYVAVLEGDLVFTYDAEAKKLVNKNALIVTNNASENLEEVAVSGYIDPLTIEYQVRNPEAAPQDPYGLEFYDEMEEWGSNSFYFSIPEFDVDGNLLEPEKLFYRIYVDGEPFIFYSDEYVGLPEDEMELINCQFTNYEDIFSSGVDKGIYLYFEGADTLGVQSVYIDTVNGEEVKTESKVVTISTNDAVRGVEAEAASVATEWFDLQGRRIANPGKGIGIRIDLKADGSRKAVKVVR